MKIGILTFHSQLNYGGVLQCWALKTALEGMGHEVEVLDWWFDDGNRMLLRDVNQWGVRDWVVTAIRAMLGLGHGSMLLRQWRTIRLIRGEFNLSPYHFRSWDSIKSVKLDAFVVGSDQVWTYSERFKPDVFMLENAPKNPAVAYAVSFGTSEFSEVARKYFSARLNRFNAVSVRERTSVPLLESCGGKPVHVADPTLMIGRSFWLKRFKPRNQRRLVYYIISESVQGELLKLEQFAMTNKCKIDVFVDAAVNPILFKSPKFDFRAWGVMVVRRIFSPVRLHLAAGPMEFARSISRAKWVVSDSFHALMFSSIYNKNVRMLSPTLPFRKRMFSRIRDFVQDFATGDVIVSDLNNALSSFSKGEMVSFNMERMDAFSELSKKWLQRSLRECQ